MARKTYKERVKQVNFIEGYNYDGELMPFVNFYKFLAKRSGSHMNNKFDQLQVYIPDTIVYNDQQDPYWLYSNYEGHIQRANKFDERDVIKKLGNPFRIDEAIAVVKTQDYDENTGRPYGNKIELLSTRFLTEKAISLQGQQSTDVTVIQKFVRCKGPYAFVCRAVWRRHKPAYTWVITNKVKFTDVEQCSNYLDRYVTKANNTLHCSFVKAKGDQNYQQIVESTQRIAMFVERNTNLKMSELAADFIKDSAGIWWLVGIKAFKLEDSFATPIFKHFLPSHDLILSEDEESKRKSQNQEKVNEYVKLRICRFCQIGYPVEELNYSLTLKMILKTERLLMNLGYFYEWLNHGDESMYEDISLYKPFAACVTCYSIFKEVDELQQVQIQLSRALGIPVRVDKENNVIFSDARKKQASSGDLLIAVFKQQNDQRQNQDSQRDGTIMNKLVSAAKKFNKNKDGDHTNPSSPQHGIKSLKESAISQVNEDEAKALPTKYLNRFKIFLIFYDLHQIESQFLDEYPNLYLEYKLMTYTARIRIRGQNIKIRLHGGRNEITELGSATFSLIDFKNELVTRKGFNVPLFGQNCFIKAIACIDMTTHQVNVTRTNLEYYNGIYVPNEDYFASDFLLDEWMPLIPKNERGFRSSTSAHKKQHIHNTDNLSEIKPLFDGSSIKKPRVKISLVDRPQTSTQRLNKQILNKRAESNSQNIKSSKGQSNLPPIQLRQQDYKQMTLNNQEKRSIGSIVSGETDIYSSMRQIPQSDRFSAHSSQGPTTYQLTVIVDNAYISGQSTKSNDWLIYYKLFDNLVFQKQLKSQRHGITQVNFGGATKDIIFESSLQEIENLIRKHNSLQLILQDISDKNITYDCKIDIRGLLVRDAVNYEMQQDMGSKIDGVYELSKKNRLTQLNPDLQGLSSNEIQNNGLNPDDEEETVLFLKAKVLLKACRTNLSEFSRISDKTKIEIRQIKINEQNNTKINIMSKK
eukprot:403376398